MSCSRVALVSMAIYEHALLRLICTRPHTPLMFGTLLYVAGPVE